MDLSNLVVPRAGVFRQGFWTGTELVVIQRRWFPAIVCWMIGALVIAWVVAGMLWPKAEFVPEPDQFRPLATIGGALMCIGIAIVMWKRIWTIDPSGRSITYASGFASGRGRTNEGSEGLWMQIHPVTVAVKGSLGWSGQAIVVHATEQEGVAVGASSSEPDARAVMRDLAEITRIPGRDAVGETLRATV